MQKFFQHIHVKQLRINKILNEIVPMKELTPEQEREYRNAKKCFNCDVEFSGDQDDENYARNHHHDHLDGNYIGPDCVRCNFSDEVQAGDEGQEKQAGNLRNSDIFS